MKQKPVIYLLPGLLCDGDAWQFQQAALEPVMEVRIADFRGMSSLRHMAEKVLETAPEKFSVAGHSMGGRVAWELAHMVPERIDHLIVLSVGAHPVDDEECEQRSGLLEEAARVGMEKYAEIWADLMEENLPTRDAGVRRIIEGMAKRQTLDEFTAHITAGLGRGDQSKYLPLISQPVLLICGDHDTWSPVTQHETIRDQIPDATLEVVRDAGHMVTLDKPEEVSKLMLRWIM